MNRPAVGKLLAAACVAVGFVATLGAATQGTISADRPLRNPTKVVGHEQCIRCHQAEVTVWQTTPHYRTFDTLHRTPEAKAIADRLGLRSVKRNETCIQCHYTTQATGPRERIIAGVSCESCHGASKDWLELHADYGPGATKETETAAHKADRRLASIALGMNNPSNLYLIARQCLACHTTPDEKLVNTGGHNAGSDGFELVSWSQGMVRHNFQRTNGQTNDPSDPARLRVMYVVGQLADLEASLRAVSRATSADKFGKQAAERAARAKQRLWEVRRRVDDPHVAEALSEVADLELRLGNSAAVARAADGVGRAAQAFSERADGAKLAAVDPLLPPPNQYK